MKEKQETKDVTLKTKEETEKLIGVIVDDISKCRLFV